MIRSSSGSVSQQIQDHEASNANKHTLVKTVKCRVCNSLVSVHLICCWLHLLSFLGHRKIFKVTEKI